MSEVKRLEDLLSSVTPKSWAPVVSLLGLLLVGWLDWATGSDLSFSLLYLLPISFAAWSIGRGAAIALSGAASILWLICDFRVAHVHPVVLYWNAVVRFAVFVLIVWLIARVRALNSGLDALVQKRTAALQSEVLRRKSIEQEAVEISHREQERVAHELHDLLGGCLGGVAFRIKSLAEAVERGVAPPFVDIQDVLTAVHSAQAQVRSFARLLNPVEGGDAKLDLALARLAAEISKVFGVHCEADTNALPELSTDQHRHLYRIAQEGVRNAVGHARARRIRIALSRTNAHLRLQVHNDGLPWEPAQESTEGLGLRIMRYRTALLGGTLSIKADPAGGTLLTCLVPLTREFDEPKPEQT